MRRRQYTAWSESFCPVLRVGDICRNATAVSRYLLVRIAARQVQTARSVCSIGRDGIAVSGYSDRNAATGSSRAPRRAGMKHPSTAMGLPSTRRSRPPVFVSGIRLAACGHDQPPVRRALLDSSLRPSCSVSAGNNSGSRLSPRHWLRLAVAVGEHIPTAGVRASTRGRDTAIHVRDVTLGGGDHSRRRTVFLTTECPARSVNATSEGPREAPAAVEE
jgi:hypothetical protein